MRGAAILLAVRAEPLTTLVGRVECEFDGCGPLGLILSGHTADHPGEALRVAFAGAAPVDFPQTLESATIECVGAQSYRIASGTWAWTVSARAAHLHRDAGAAFFAALPPPPVRWSQSLFWRIVLALAASSAGRWLLRLLRGG